MQFGFLPIRFEFTAAESLFFAPGKAGNILRGALGLVFRRISCHPDCADVRTCELRRSCIYAGVFEPVATEGPSGLMDSPRPFVLRARHLDGRTIVCGQGFHIDVNLFALDHSTLDSFVRAFGEIGREGFSPRRGKADLRRAVRMAFGDLAEALVYDDASGMVADSVEPAAIDLSRAASAPGKIRVEFLSPTELKHENRVAARPEFAILFGRIRDRVSNLRRLYGAGPPDIDFEGMGRRAAEVRMTRCEGGHVEAERRSSRTGRSHSIGGFAGAAEYEGDLAEFLPWLEAARWTGVGRHAVWGKGEIAVSAPADVATLST